MGLFVGGFLLCFGLQLVTLLVVRNPLKDLAVDLLGNDFTMFSLNAQSVGEYAGVIIGMVVYTLSNYIFNRCVTFRN